MRKVTFRACLSLAILLFILTPTVAATPDGMVLYCLIVALVTSLPLAIADRSSERVLAWLLMVCSICLALVFWARALDMFHAEVRNWQSQALSGAVTTAPTNSVSTSLPTTKP
jgi:hypothetical protein